MPDKLLLRFFFEFHMALLLLLDLLMGVLLLVAALRLRPGMYKQTPV
jgi:hypothetical protein